VVGSLLTNFRTTNTPKNTLEVVQYENKTFQQNDWVAILERAPQYKKAQVLESTTPVTSEVHISDGQVIGILDKPSSVLIYVDQPDSLEPLLLTTGEGWLPNWIIEQIRADSVVWVNIENQESYTQFLFKDKSAEQRKSTTEISGIK
jgi:hypothetical protein